jgi:hypothetical protein
VEGTRGIGAGHTVRTQLVERLREHLRSLSLGEAIGLTVAMLAAMLAQSRLGGWTEMMGRAGAG